MSTCPSTMDEPLTVVVKGKPTDINELKVVELRVELIKLGISTAGKKAELIDKLRKVIRSFHPAPFFHSCFFIPKFVIFQSLLLFSSTVKSAPNFQEEKLSYHMLSPIATRGSPLKMNDLALRNLCIFKILLKKWLRIKRFHFY